MQNVIDLASASATRAAGGDVQSRSAYVNGVNIAFSSQGEGPPLVLLMGYRLNSSAWPREFLEVLARHFTLITIDNRGTGGSDKPVAGYALANLARDVCGVLDHLRIERAHMLGYSMGGAIAQEFVCQFPARVAGLVLCATMCGGPRAVYARLSVLRVTRELDGLRPEEIARRIWKVTYAPHYLAENREKVERQMLREISSPTPLHAADLQFQAFSDFDCSLALPDVRAPTLVLTGDLDELIPPVNSTVIAELIPGAELNVMRGYAHRVLWEAPERCAATISGFLMEVDEQRGQRRLREAAAREVASSEASCEARQLELTASLAESWWHNMGLFARLPFLMGDFAADFFIHSIQPAFFGGRLPAGDGKPIVIVPGGMANCLVLSNLSLWLKGNNYRPMQAAPPLDLDSGSVDGALSKTLRTAALRVGRKVVILAFDAGIEPALRAADDARGYVSDVVGFDPPLHLNTSPGTVRLHLIASREITGHDDAALYRTKAWPWPTITSPDALLTLSRILRDVRIELRDPETPQH
ncbi:MAG: alpha/beta fold hydrolase [Methylobacteriaceae bacterium]|nr:alpha/beta fold hydrolase [Methylobacteriaceae bacterium]